MPNATHRIYAKALRPALDLMGLRIMPDATLKEAPRLDILHVRGGGSQEALMEDEEVLGWLRRLAFPCRNDNPGCPLSVSVVFQLPPREQA